MTEVGIHSIPNVAHYFPEIEEIVTDGQNGYIFSHTETVIMAHKIRELLDDNNKRNSVSYRSWELPPRFNEEQVMSIWQQLFDALFSCSSRADLRQQLEVVKIITTNQLSEFETQAIITEYEESLS